MTSEQKLADEIGFILTDKIPFDWHGKEAAENSRSLVIKVSKEIAACAVAALRASAEPSASVRAVALDVVSHRDAWRNALLRLQTPFGSDDDGSYWAHELEVFDRSFAVLSATPSPIMQAAGKAAPQASAESTEPVAYRHKHFQNDPWQYRENKTFGTPYPYYEPLYLAPHPSRIDAAAEPTREGIAKAAFNLAEAVECSIDLDLHPLLKKRVDATKSALKSKPRGEPAREGGEDVAAGLRPERA